MTTPTARVRSPNPRCRRLSDDGLLAAAQSIYAVPSLAAWRAAELRALRELEFVPPILEIGCGNGLFAKLLLDDIEVGIDLSCKEVRKCTGIASVYGSVLQMDARHLAFKACSFGTVFANCVLEHIPQLDRALAECHRVLRPGGKLIATVPIKGMERHLLFPWPSYARWRRSKLRHVNLFEAAEWKGKLEAAGFRKVNVIPYLPAALCGRWDRVDAPLCAGFGRLTLSAVYRVLFAVSPVRVRQAVNRWWKRYFLPVLAEPSATEPCAIVLEAFY